MKAIVVREFGGPEVMRHEEVPDPVPQSGQVLVKVQAAGVNPVDTYIRTGTYPLRPQLPYTPGMDGAGVVEATGDGVRGLAAGDRVYFSRCVSGSYAEKALCRDAQVHRLHERLSISQGACIGIPYATAYRALFQRAGARAGETVLIHGATGGVGIAALQLARAGGMRVIGTGGTSQGRQLAKVQGAHLVLDHGDPAHIDQIMEETRGEGVDVIIEMLANVNLGRDLPILARRGRVVIVGSRGKVEIDPRDVMGRDGAILGMVILNATDDELEGIYAAVDAGLENGTLRPVVGLEIPLNEAARAHHEVMDSPSYGKIVLVA